MTTKEGKKRHRLCNEDCNHCDVIFNEQLAVLLNVLALKFGEEVWHITNRVCANMTCCPICRIDDFCHDVIYDSGDNGILAIDRIRESESCKVAEMAKKIFKEFNSKRASR